MQIMAHRLTSKELNLARVLQKMSSKGKLKRAITALEQVAGEVKNQTESNTSSDDSCTVSEDDSGIYTSS